MLVPFNFHDRSVSQGSSQGVRLNFAEKAREAPHFFGHHFEDGIKLESVSRERDKGDR